jgi:FkbH-like protein
MSWKRTFKYSLHYGRRFLTSPGFRQHVFEVLGRATGSVSTTATASAEGDGTTPEPDFSHLKGKKIYLSGGCELDFVDWALEEAGLEPFHTFKFGRPSEALADFSDPTSPLWTKDADAILLSNVTAFLEVVKRLQKEGFHFSRLDQEAELKRAVESYASAIKLVRSRISKPIFLFTYPMRLRPSFGIHDYVASKENISYTEFFRTYELMVYALAKTFEGVYVVDANHILAEVGMGRGIELEQASGYCEHLSRAGGAAIAKNIRRQLAVLSSASSRVKCAVFDLDGTMWHGVIREDGPAGISPYWPVFNVMQDLATRGVLLAICSKNDEAELEHLPGIMSPELYGKFVAKRLNWLPKSHNLKDIAKELNIGLDSLAFFDDNPRERAEVAENAKGVRIFTEKDIIPAIERPEFEPLGGVTAEAFTRVEKYVEQSQRQEAERGYDPADYESFLKASKLRLELRRPAGGEMPRVDELIQRSNQLNATMKRTQKSQLNEFFAKPAEYDVFIANLSDKFGDYGLIGVAIAQKKGASEAWQVLELAFSCRAMGRRVEHSLINHMCREAQRQGATRIGLPFVETPRNKEMLKILSDVGFGQDASGGGGGLLIRDLSSGDFTLPSWFEVDAAPPVARQPRAHENGESASAPPQS